MKGVPQHIFATAFPSHLSAPLSICATVYKVLYRSSSFHSQKLFLKLFTWNGDSDPRGRDPVLCCHSVVSDQDLCPAKTQRAWFQNLTKLRFLMSRCRKNSVRDTVISNNRFLWIKREAHFQGRGPSQRVSVCQGMFDGRVPTCSLMSPFSLLKRNSVLLPGTEVIVWGRLGSPLVNILFRTKLLSLVPLSWDMDCLLTLWLTLPLVPLVTVAVHLVFWSLSFPKEVSCTTAYIYS